MFQGKEFIKSQIILVKFRPYKMKTLTLFFINLIICFLYDQKAESSYLLVKLEKDTTISGMNTL